MPSEEHPRYEQEYVMDEHSLDELAKRVVTTGILSRRRALKLVGASLLGMVGVASLPKTAEARKKKRKKRKKRPSSVPDAGTAQVNGRVNAILVVGNRVYLGGEFSQVNGLPRNRLAALDASTGQLTSWAPSANGRVMALAASADGTRIYAGGGFTSVSGLARPQLAAIGAATGAVDQGWRPAASHTVYSLAVVGNRVYVGGYFTAVNGQSRSRLAMVDGTNGALDPTWRPSATNTVRTLVPSRDGTRIYAGGQFDSISGASRPYLGALHPTTGAVLSWRPTTRPNGLVYKLAESGGRVFTAESGVGGAAAAYDTVTGSRAWQAWADGDVQAVAVFDSRVYVGGHFLEIGGQGRRYFAALDPATGALDAGWRPSGEGHAGPWTLVSDASRGRLYAGGDFVRISGLERQKLAQFSE